MRQRLTLFLAKERASDYERLAKFIAAGQLTPPLGRTYPLEQAAAAMRVLRTSAVRGKLAITL